MCVGGAGWGGSLAKVRAAVVKAAEGTGGTALVEMLRVFPAYRVGHKAPYPGSQASEW